MAPHIENADQIIAALDVADVIGRRVALRTQGRDLVGRCPFHGSASGRNNSFHVSPDRGAFYCFGCHKGGDAVTFVRDLEGLEFAEALELLAAECNLTVRYAAARARSDAPDDDQAAAEGRSIGPTRSDLYAATAAAARHYAATLEGAEGDRARTYLVTRGFQASSVAIWGFGYACADHVAECGADPDHLVAAGVLRRGKDGTRLYDPLAGRVILPIADHTGRPVAFVGRLLEAESDRPKYLNTAETAIWRKDRILFGWRQAMDLVRAGAGPVHILEGQLKVIACIEAGIPAVAAGGTGFSDRQAALVARLGDTAVVCPDPDQPGRQAAVRVAEALRAECLTVRVGSLVIPDHVTEPVKDPDDLARLGFPVAYDTEDLVPWLYRQLVGTGQADSPDKARTVAMEILPLIAAHPMPAVQAAEYRALAEQSGILEDYLRVGQTRPAAVLPPPTENDGAEPFDDRMTAGRYLCALLLQLDTGHDPAWWARHVRALELPEAMLGTLRVIFHVRKIAAERGIPVARAIEAYAPGTLRRPLLYWSSVQLPGEPGIEALRLVQDRILEGTHR